MQAAIIFVFILMQNMCDIQAFSICWMNASSAYMLPMRAIHSHSCLKD